MSRLIDVAKAAGVSRSTASNVYNYPELVRPKLRKRVEDAARELGYPGPDPKGRLLRDGKFSAIGVVAPKDWGVAAALENPVFQLFLRGVGQICDDNSANLVIIPDLGDGSSTGNALVDGFIFGRVEHISQVEPARLRQVPFTVVDFDPGPMISSIRVDAHAGAYAAARHLINLGHRRFAIISFLRSAGPARLHLPGIHRGAEAAGMPTDQEKLRGYSDALAEAGIDIETVPIVQADPWDRDAARIILDAAPDATCILSMSVMQGLNVLEEARRRGLQIPRDLSVVGYNDIQEAAVSAPPLTTVNGMGVEKGRAAAKAIFGGGLPRHEILQPYLILRDSTGPAPA